MMLQRFDLSAADPNYQLKIKQTLTIKPDGLHMYARRRPVKIVEAGSAAPQQATAPDRQAVANGIPIRVLYGSNAGTSQPSPSASPRARSRGYTSSVDSLDSATGTAHRRRGRDRHLSYEGQPPDNARSFVAWMDGLPPGALAGVRYAVFGVGNKDWARTYQAMPKKVDETLATLGAERLVERGEANARGDFFGEFEDWYEGFWGPVGAEFDQLSDAPSPTAALQVEFVGGTRDPILRQNGLQTGTVVANRELVDMSVPGARSKRTGDRAAAGRPTAPRLPGRAAATRRRPSTAR